MQMRVFACTCMCVCTHKHCNYQSVVQVPLENRKHLCIIPQLQSYGPSSWECVQYTFPKIAWYVMVPVLTCTHVMVPVLTCTHVMVPVLTCTHVMVPVLTCTHVMVPVLTCMYVMVPVLTSTGSYMWNVSLLISNLGDNNEYWPKFSKTFIVFINIMVAQKINI